MNILQRGSLRYLLRHPAQILLAILGVALGVSVVVAIDLANQSAQKAFMLSTETLSGKATDQIIGGANGIPSNVYRTIRVELGIEAAAPVIQTTARIARIPGRSFEFLGIDPFSEGAFRSYLAPQDSRGNLEQLIIRPGTALLGEQVASELQLNLGDSFEIQLAGVTRTLDLIGIIAAQDQLSQQALGNLIVVDISSASELLNRKNRIDRIDLILPEANAEQLRDQITSTLPPDLQLTTPSRRSNALEQMTKAFEVNLQALSLLALIVGIFLIYNTMTFSVVQRRRLFGTLRSLGVTRQTILWSVLTEAAAIGLIGSLLGIVLGIILGQGLVRLVTQTINDLYFSVNVRSLSLEAFPLIKGFCLGIGATLAAASIPATEAMFAPPMTVLRRSSSEERIRQLLPRTLLIGFAGLAFGLGILQIPSRSLPLSFSGLFIIVISCALLTPGVTYGLMALIQPVMGRFAGVLGRKAARDVVASLSRTGIAIAALMIAVSVTVGAGTMIYSFRNTVVHWLDSTLKADIFISSPSVNANRVTTPLEPDVVERVISTPGLADYSTLTNLQVESPYGTTYLSALQLPGPAYQQQALAFLTDADAAWQGFLDGGVWISEPYAFRTGLKRGDQLELVTDQGPQQFPVVGIFYDYSSEAGIVMINNPTYQQYWSFNRVASIAVWVEPERSVEAVKQRIEEQAGTNQVLEIQANRSIREGTLAIFDRTFAIADVLQLLATIVAFIGILSALMALQLERARELGVLRAIGLTPRQLWQLVLSQTTLMGITAGLLALPVGMILAYVLVFVINKRSFGWTLQLEASPALLIQAMILSIVAALLAGIYPAWKMARSAPALALREE